MFSAGLGAAPNMLLPLFVGAVLPPNTLLLLVVAPKIVLDDDVAAPNENPVLGADAGAVAAEAPKLNPPVAGFVWGAPKIEAGWAVVVAKGFGAAAAVAPNPPAAGAGTPKVV